VDGAKCMAGFVAIGVDVVRVVSNNLTLYWIGYVLTQ
jgi:hypothetical protein